MVSSEEMERERARGRGALSPADREALLLTEEEYLETHSRQALSQRKKAIRDRTRDALKDMSLLYDHLDEETLYSIFYRDEAGVPERDDQRDLVHEEERRGLRDAIRGTLAFLLWGESGRGHFHMAVENQQGLEKTSFIFRLEEAIEAVGIRHGVLIDEIEPMVLRGKTAPGIESVLKRAQEGEELRTSEIELLRKSGRVDEEQLAEALKQAVTGE